MGEKISLGYRNKRTSLTRYVCILIKDSGQKTKRKIFCAYVVQVAAIQDRCTGTGDSLEHSFSSSISFSVRRETALNKKPNGAGRRAVLWLRKNEHLERNRAHLCNIMNDSEQKQTCLPSLVEATSKSDFSYL